MARSETIRTGGVGVDTSDFRAVAKALRKAAPASSRALRRQLRAAGEIVAGEARELAEEHSSTIAQTIKVRVVGTTVAVVAGGADAPLAALYEAGNKTGPDPDTFRHPVYGNRDVWVSQPRYPFIRPAVLANRAEIEEAVTEALDEAVRTILTPLD